MLRDQFLTHHKAVVDGFRWRSREIARIEGFSDACFGFAVTLLIISLEVPRTSTELFEAMHGFIAFFATFSILAGIWYGQFLYFRRYGIEDRITVMLNLLLIFTVLFFVYPMKFFFTTVIEHGGFKGTVAGPHGLEPIILPEHKPLLFLVFGAGYAAVFTSFFFLYRHAYRQREALGLNELEVVETQHSMRAQIFAIGTGLTYLALAGIEALPRRTPHEKLLARGLALASAVVILALVVWIIRHRRQRSVWMKEWRERQPEVILHPPAGE